MPIQNSYDLYTKNSFEGQKAYSSEVSVQVTGILTAPELDFGRSVKHDATVERGVGIGSTSGNVFGISMREINWEATSIPSTGDVVYKQNRAVSVMREGTINVKVTGAINAFEKVHVDETTGEFLGNAGGTEALNVVALENGLAGDIIKVRIDIIAD